ncbi:MAG: hypothetical protein AAGD04_00275 [Pseudomonadota bacterium]
MERFERLVPLPDVMQGRWVALDDNASELIISGGEINSFGSLVEYDYKLIGIEDGATIVSLKTNDTDQEDAFQQANITELVITPEGEFHAYNVSFSSQFVQVID